MLVGRGRLRQDKATLAPLFPSLLGISPTPSSFIITTTTTNTQQFIIFVVDSHDVERITIQATALTSSPIDTQQISNRQNFPAKTSRPSSNLSPKPKLQRDTNPTTPTQNRQSRVLRGSQQTKELSILQPPRITPKAKILGLPMTRCTFSCEVKWHSALMNPKHQTPNTKHQTPNTKHQTPNTKHLTPNPKPNSLSMREPEMAGLPVLIFCNKYDSIGV